MLINIVRYFKNVVFKSFGNFIKSCDNYEEYILLAIKDPKFQQFRSLVSYLKSGYLELGSATQCLKLCNGKTSERVKLLKELKNYIIKFCPVLFENKIISTIDFLSKNYRNPAVHEKTFGIEDLREVRELTSDLLNSIVNPRLIDVKT